MHINEQWLVQSTEEDVGNIAGTVFAVLINILFFVVLPIGICICVGCCIRSHNRSRHRPPITRVVSPNPSSRGTTLVTSNQSCTAVPSSNQMTSSFIAMVPYPQEPVYKDAQFSCQDAPPSYFEATAYPSCNISQAAEVL